MDSDDSENEDEGDEDDDEDDDGDDDPDATDVDMSPVASSPAGTHSPLRAPECSPYRRPDAHVGSKKLQYPVGSHKPSPQTSSVAQLNAAAPQPPSRMHIETMARADTPKSNAPCP